MKSCGFIVERLREALSDVKGLELVYLFGSLVEDPMATSRDVDVAVLTESGEACKLVARTLSKELGISEDEVDVVNLRFAPSSLIIAILKNGVRLLGSDEKEDELLSRIPMELVEFGDSILRETLIALSDNPINRLFIDRVIQLVTKRVEWINKLTSSRKLDEVLADEDLLELFERRLHKAVEGIMDLIKHVIRGLRLGIAEGYKEYMRIACLKGIIDAESAALLERLVDVRNRLVHEYLDVNYLEIWENAKALSRGWRTIAMDILKYLEKHA